MFSFHIACSVPDKWHGTPYVLPCQFSFYGEKSLTFILRPVRISLRGEEARDVKITFCSAIIVQLQIPSHQEKIFTLFSLTMKRFSAYLLCRSLLIVMESENNFVLSDLFWEYKTFFY